MSWLAILIAALAPFVLGYLWYGPLFGKAWQKEAGLDDAAIARGNMPMIFGLTFVLNVVAAIVLAQLLGPRPSLGNAVWLGALLGFGLVAGSYCVSYLFAQRSFALMAIDGLYMAARVVLIAIVLAVLG
jgi:hypothetical protein